MKAVWTIARRELRSVLDHPMGYILLVVFLGVNNFLFFRSIEVAAVATLRPMLGLLPWLLLFLVPAVTMRALAEDIRGGTIEVVLAQPITELELLLGKYVGQVLFLWLALALTLTIPAGLALGADLQVGAMIAQYLGAALLMASLAAVGVWASSVTPNQVTAFIVAVTVTFLLILVGLDPLLVGLPPRLGALATWLGVLGHFESIARGLIDLRDVVYFVSLAGVFLALAYFSLQRRKLAPGGVAARQLRLGVAMLVVAAILASLALQPVTLRLDLTPGRSYTLARGTRNVLGNLPDLVTIKLFASRELPPEVTFLRRELDDVLRDYRSAGRGKLRLVVRDPAADTAAAREARSLGIPPVQFNVRGEGQLTIKEGWLGLAVQYAGQSRIQPVIRQTEDLEYRLTSDIRQLVRPAKPTVGLFTEPTPPGAPAAFEGVGEELSAAYTVQPVTLTDTGSLATMTAIVALGTPDTLDAAQLARFNAFVDNGGSLLIMASGMNLAGAGQGIAQARRVGWNAVLRRYGVTIQSDFAYDLVSNEAVAMPTQFGRLMMQYPFWLRALSTKRSPMNADIDAMFVPWSSTIGIDSAQAATVTPLFTTSAAGGVEQNVVMIQPQREFRRDSLSARVVSAAVNPAAGDSVPAGSPKGRVVVVGSAEAAGDRFARNAPGNMVFLLGAVDWLAQDEDLIAIRAKTRAPPPLAFTSPVKRGLVRYGNLIGIPALVIAVGVAHLWRRRRKTGQPYVPATMAEGAA